MQTKIQKIIAVLNDFTLSERVLEKAFDFATRYGAVVEVLYVHETPLFAVPDYFASTEGEGVDKEKIREALKEKVSHIAGERKVAIFVNVDDTEDRVAHLTGDDKDVLIITAYHDKITQKLIDKVSQEVLVIKNETSTYAKMALILDVNTLSLSCIKNTQAIFPDTHIHLLYDYRYVVDPSMEMDLQNVQIIEDAQKKAFEEVKEKSGLEGDFFIDGSFFGDDLIQYIQAKAFDIVYVCSHGDDFFVSDTLCQELLDEVDCDLLVATK